MINPANRIGIVNRDCKELLSSYAKDITSPAEWFFDLTFFDPHFPGQARPPSSAKH